MQICGLGCGLAPRGSAHAPSLLPGHSWAARQRRRPCRTMAGRQMSVAAPQPQPPAPAGSGPPQLPPRWAFAAGAAVVGAAALRMLWMWYAARTSNDLVPSPAAEPEPAAGAQDPTQPTGGAAAVDVARAAVQLAVAEAGAQLAAAKTSSAEAAEAAAAAPAVVGELASSAEVAKVAAAAAADAAAEAVGPVVLAAETGGAVSETATMTLEQLQGMATELYIVIQQMELQLGELVDELSGRLPEAGVRALDELMAQLDEVEERLESLKGVEGAEGEVAASEREWSDLQWRKFDVVARGASDSDRRTYRSLLFNLTTQRRLLRQVESQEALRLRMREVELRIAALLGEEEDAEEQQQPGRQQAAAQPSKQQQVQAAAGQAAGQGESYTAAEQRRMQPKMVYWESTGPVQPIVGRQAAVPGGGGAAPGELRLVAAGVSMPHPAKAATGGEDAFFVSSWGQGAVGVADGVGGWAAEGVNPALYPRRLMEACEEALAPSGRGLLDGEPCCQQPRCRDKPPSSSGSGDGSSSTDGEQAAPAGPPPGAALTVLQSAHQRTSEPGSCTVILALLQPSGQLSVANLGDTELRVVRGGRIAFKTKAQEHMWNMPLQLSCPTFYDCGSRPTDADQAALEVQEGDIVVLGSDGLFDNMWDEQILEAVAEEQVGGAGSVEELAEALALRLARTAHRQSLDQTFLSPFTAELQERAGPDMGRILPQSGGKADDVTAVVAVVARG